MKETELFKPVKDWLEERGYEVFAEVQAWGGARADIIGRNRPVIAAVELKTSLTMELIDQAIKWRAFCHYVYIAIPMRQKPIPAFVRKILIENRIGVLEVDTRYFQSVHVKQPARFNRPYGKTRGSVRTWDELLKEEHKTWVQGGNAGGGYVTPYALTIDRVKRYLQMKRDWTPLNEILDHCETHYSNPKAGLSQALRNFESDWCEAKIINRRLHYRAIPDVTR